MPQSEWPKSAAGYETICELGKSAHGSTWKASCTENGRIVSIKRLNFDAQANLSFELFDAIRKEVSLSMTFSHKCIQSVHAAFVNDSELWIVVDYMDKVGASSILHLCVGCSHVCVSLCRLQPCLCFVCMTPPAQGSLADVIQQCRRSGQVVDERFVFHVASQLLSAMYVFFSFPPFFAPFFNIFCMLYLGKNGVVHRGIRSSRVLISGNGRVQLADFRLSGILTFFSRCPSCMSLTSHQRHHSRSPSPSR